MPGCGAPIPSKGKQRIGAVFCKTQTVVISIGARDLSHNLQPARLSPIPTMEAKSRRSKEREGAISALNTAVEALKVVGNTLSVTPAKTAFSSVSALLAMIRVRFLLFFKDLLLFYTWLGLDG